MNLTSKIGTCQFTTVLTLDCFGYNLGAATCLNSSAPPRAPKINSDLEREMFDESEELKHICSYGT